ncbi:sensor histidine kinase [Pseudorhodoferax aquiterrae]|uniref:Diguanylate cyclase DosC n=1 Tax=Pseudorhodoferax aquiterrae TaxID=747304 RepID=A0ABQ3G5I2_9BURK|nr:sensor histidine kinase [Pseudorhodoferax aquiterrae]
MTQRLAEIARSAAYSAHIPAADRPDEEPAVHIAKTLLEQFNINEMEIIRRMELLDLTQRELDLLAAQQPVIERKLAYIVARFYEKQTAFDEIALLIGDADTLARLRAAQTRYIQDLFAGDYGHAYVNGRLRIGLVHKRIGVEPKLFLSAACTLKYLLSEVLAHEIEDRSTLLDVLRALDKLMNFDNALVFDTYIGTLLSAMESAKKRIETYAHALEQKSKILSTHAERDPLTELYNKRGMTMALTRELNAAQRRKSQVSLVYMDVNKFKFINDTFGHAKGDEVLRALGEAIAKSCRSTDFACRVGGDEFCVILPDAAPDVAEGIAEKIAEAFTALFPEFSVAAGVAGTGPEQFMTESELLEAADKAMYAAKRAV